MGLTCPWAADELVLLHEGRVAASGPVSAVLAARLIEAVCAARVDMTTRPGRQAGRRPGARPGLTFPSHG